MNSIKSEGFFDGYDSMHQANVVPSLLTAHLAGSYLKDGGLCVLTGAEFIFKNPAGNMMDYALSKNLVHSLAHNLAQSGNLAEGSSLVTILP